MKKPSASTIRNAEPLTARAARVGTAIGPDRMLACNVCALPSEELTVWREHDERDQPIEGNGALVFIARDHAACIKAMENHPRLYAEETGLPGNFPKLCGGCTYRVALECTHPKLKKNGGPGLNVQLSNAFGNVIICSRGHGCHRPLRHAMSCEGQRLKGET